MTRLVRFVECEGQPALENIMDREQINQHIRYITFNLGDTIFGIDILDIREIENGVSMNLTQTATAVGEIAKDVTVSSERAGLVSENIDVLLSRMEQIQESTGSQNSQTDQLASIADKLKKLTKTFRI